MTLQLRELPQLFNSMDPSPFLDRDLDADAEEFIVGEEHSFEVASIRGRPVWWSLTKYAPTPLEVVRNPWIQWTVLMPRETDGYDDVQAVGFAALKALGFSNGDIAWHYVKWGLVIAAAGAQRSAMFPDLPTVAESGVPGFATGNWWGMFAPAGLPPARGAALLGNSDHRVLPAGVCRDARRIS